ncbi:MAG: FAD-binding oxidoreductase [Rhodocyclaceae bacterium]|nr:FAD-binding oxidoreductase [Rhodocyclaceae bacterium]
MTQVSAVGDVVIVGGGIAGASAAYFLAQAGQRVVLLERETQPGYHSTGRSAAMFTETYGPPLIRALTAASRIFLESPPHGFAEHPLLTPRGVLMVAAAGEEPELARFIREAGGTVALEALSATQARERVPVLQPAAAVAAALEPAAMDIDVHALLWGFVRQFRRAGGELVTDAEVVSIQRDGARWRLADRSGRVFEAGVVVNAAGAWADELARLAGVAPLGLVPKRRTALTVEVDPALGVGGWPMVSTVGEGYYFKPDAGRLLVSPADETPTVPQDVQPEDLDIAIAIDRFTTATAIEVQRPASTWAGLRSFFGDGLPVSGFDPAAPGFYWLAGQGGYGIQTSPAMGRLAAALIADSGVPEDLLARGVSAGALAPGRAGLRRSG